MRKTALSFFWIVAAVTACSGQSTLYFPQIADGAQGGGINWISCLGLTNTASPGAPAATGSITFTQDNGSPWSLALIDETSQPVGTGSTISFQLAGAETRFYCTTGVSPVATGFATVTSGPTVTGGAAFLEFADNGNTAAGSAGVLAASPLTQQMIFVARGEQTAVAIANHGTSTATITFQLLDKNGAVVLPSVTRTLAAKNHSALFANQLFPNIPARFFGTLRITSSIPLVATSLIFDSQFYTVPVFSLQ